jgi:hypothetical protein
MLDVNHLEHITKEIMQSDLRKSEPTQKYAGYVKREEKQMILSQQTTIFQVSPTHPCFLPIDPVIQEEKTHHHQNYDLHNGGSTLRNTKTKTIPTPNPGLSAKSRKSLFLILENKCNL